MSCSWVPVKSEEVSEENEEEAHIAARVHSGKSSHIPRILVR